MSSLNYMSLRDFEFLSFFLEILCFLVPHYTRQILQKIDAKRNDHVFPKLNEPSWFLQIFVLENNIFHIFHFLFPNWYIHETIHNLIFNIFIVVSRLRPFRSPKKDCVIRILVSLKIGAQSTRASARAPEMKKFAQWVARSYAKEDT